MAESMESDLGRTLNALFARTEAEVSLNGYHKNFWLSSRLRVASFGVAFVTLRGWWWWWCCMCRYRPGNEYLETSITPESGPTPPCTSNCSKKSNIGLIVGASLGGVLGLLIVLVLAIFACRRWKRKRNPSGAEQGPPRPQLMSMYHFLVSTISAFQLYATDF